MYNILNSIPFVNLYTELATVIRLAVVVVFCFFYKYGIQMCTTAIIIIIYNSLLDDSKMNLYDHCLFNLVTDEVSEIQTEYSNVSGFALYIYM